MKCNSYLNFIFQIFKDGATYHGHMKTHGHYIVKTYYSNAINPTTEDDMNSNQYECLIGENVTKLLNESLFMLGKCDANVCVIFQAFIY